MARLLLAVPFAAAHEVLEVYNHAHPTSFVRERSHRQAVISNQRGVFVQISFRWVLSCWEGFNHKCSMRLQYSKGLVWTPQHTDSQWCAACSLPWEVLHVLNLNNHGVP
jgi:hypothetical protein